MLRGAGGGLVRAGAGPGGAGACSVVFMPRWDAAVRESFIAVGDNRATSRSSQVRLAPDRRIICAATPGGEYLGDQPSPVSWASK